MKRSLFSCLALLLALSLLLCACGKNNTVNNTTSNNSNSSDTSDTETGVDDTTVVATVNGTDIPNPDYVLPEGCESFVRNWFSSSDEINPDKLSLNDTVGDLIFNSEVQRLVKNHAKITIDNDMPLLKPIG